MGQHFVPRMYLKRFSYKSNRRDRNPPVWTHQFDKGIWRNQRIADVAQIPDYYRLGEHLPDPNELDRKITALENEGGPIVAKYYKRDLVPTDEQRFWLAVLIGRMFVVGPRKIDMSHELLLKVLNDEASKREAFYAENPIHWMTKLDQYFVQLGVPRLLVPPPPSPREMYERIRKDPKVDIGFSKATAFNRIEKFVRLLLRMGWTFLETDDSAPFITSDNPVIQVPHKQGIATFVCPLSKHRLVIIEAHVQGVRYGTASRETVEQINVRSGRNADALIISSDNMAPGVDMIIAERNRAKSR
jgi:hypothetical protein